MKTPWQHTLLMVCGLGLALIIATLLPPRAPAQEVKPAVPSTEAPPVATAKPAEAQAPKTDPKPEAKDQSTAIESPALREFLKLVDGGVSKEIMIVFINQSSIAYQLTAGDIVALKQRGVADEVIAALMTHGAGVKGQTAQLKGPVAVPAIVRDFSTGGSLDPDSYEFWYYHYAYPRALSYSYKTLAPYYPPYVYGRTYSHGPRYPRPPFK